MGALIVSSLIAIAAANAGVWWLWGRDQADKVRSARAAKKATREQNATLRATCARQAAKIASLDARNEMLTDLVGEEVPSWPTPPA